MANHECHRRCVRRRRGAVGLEDNIWYDDKRTVLATNAMLVERVCSLQPPGSTPATARCQGYAGTEMTQAEPTVALLLFPDIKFINAKHEQFIRQACLQGVLG